MPHVDTWQPALTLSYKQDVVCHGSDCCVVGLRTTKWQCKGAGASQHQEVNLQNDSSTELPLLQLC